MLRVSGGTLLAAGLWPGALGAQKDRAAGDFYFLVVNDLHLLNDRCIPWFEILAKQMKAHRETIQFLLVVGDLVEDGKPEQFKPVQTILKKLDFPVHSVVGNHDYRTMADRQPYEEFFPRSINYHIEHRGWQFLGLDSSEGNKAKVTVQPPTLTWLDATLPKLDKKKPMVMFTHFPFGALTPYRAANADQVLERFKEHNLKAVYNGHFHGFTERKHGETVLTTNRCCSYKRNNHDGTKEKGYFLCHARDGKIERTFVEVKPV
jgi:predicted MPP superfamily phosphohydrolase